MFREKKLDNYLQKLSNGEDSYLEKIYLLTKKDVYAYAMSILKNPEDSEDILQETYVRVFNSVYKYESQGKPMAWLLKITRNLCYMKIRSQKEKENIDEYIDVLKDNSAFSIEDRIFLERLLKSLSVEELEILSMHVISGFKHKEIASYLDLPVNTVISKYNRMLKKLNGKIEKVEKNEK